MRHTEIDQGGEWQYTVTAYMHSKRGHGYIMLSGDYVHNYGRTKIEKKTSHSTLKADNSHSAMIKM